MMSAGAALSLILIIVAVIWPLLTVATRWPILLGSWLLLGMTYSALVTPGGRLLRRSSNDQDRPALFAAQFSLSHACWLVAYPVVGWMGAKVGIAAALWAMAVLAVLGVVVAYRLWPREEPDSLAHSHGDLPADHPHLLEHRKAAAEPHAHAYVIDNLHTQWPVK